MVVFGCVGNRRHQASGIHSSTGPDASAAFQATLKGKACSCGTLKSCPIHGPAKLIIVPAATRFSTVIDAPPAQGKDSGLGVSKVGAKLDDDNRPLGDDIHFNLPKGGATERLNASAPQVFSEAAPEGKAVGDKQTPTQDDYSGDAGAAEEQDERKVVHIDPTFNSNPPAGPTPSHQTAAGMATGAAMPLQVGERSPEQAEAAANAKADSEAVAAEPAPSQGQEQAADMSTGAILPALEHNTEGVAAPGK